MLQAHSPLWHYFWLGPQILLAGLGFLLWRKGLHRTFPLFFAYAILGAAEEFTLYAMDVIPLGSVAAFWHAYFVCRVVEGLLKILVISELFRRLVEQWPVVSSIGNRLIAGLGTILILLAVYAAAYTKIDNPNFAIVSRAHILEQTFGIIQSGLLLFLFVFAAHFRLTWDHRTLGIAMGFGLVVCEHLATWAVMASGALMDKRYLLDFLNMAIYHLAVLIWCYYLLVPQKEPTTSAVPLPENNLAIWNRELERLIR